MKPEPRRDAAGKWLLDLRGRVAEAFGVRPGRYWLPLDPAASEVDAIHAAYALLTRLRAERAADVAAGAAVQLPLPDAATADSPPERTFSEAVAATLEARERQRLAPGSAAYVRSYLASVDRELGHLALSVFEPPGGSELLERYRNQLCDAGHGPKTRRNRLNVAMQVLSTAAGRGWLRSYPIKPVPTVGDEVLNAPVFEWYTEADFRAFRAGLYANHDAPSSRLRVELPDRAARLDYIARRRMFLSFGFYTGMHTYDLERIDDSWVSVDMGCYERRNHKSARAVPSTWLDMPEQLKLDCQEELRRLGRPWRRAELVTGGEWPNGTFKALRTTAERLGLGAFNFRIARRSCVREYCLRGWSEADVAEVMGHVDTSMIRSVYSRIPVRFRSPTKIPWDLESSRRLLGGPTSTAPILNFRKR